ncbi:MAG: MBL fold metallo-hydrolase [Thermoanaerobacteraceae bacterium]|nr:MBL fold metallo-hydrolase [Thermoanaerobacteraceae bacterium]
MDIIKINGHSSYIPGNTNVGVYTYKNGYCLLVDSGINNTAGRRISEVLEGSGLKPKYMVNTHAHTDHYGGNRVLKELYPGLSFFVSPMESVFMKVNELESYSLYGANPYRKMKDEMFYAKEFNVDWELLPGEVEIDDKRFNVLPLRGHTIGQIGIVTDDKVAYIGDALFDEKRLDIYVPFLYDVEAELKTLELLENIEADFFVLGHADRVFEDIKPLVRLNRENLDEYIGIIIELLDQPKTMEGLASEVFILKDINIDLMRYYTCMAGIKAFVSYLLDKEEIACDVQDGKLYFYRK